MLDSKERSSLDVSKQQGNFLRCQKHYLNFISVFDALCQVPTKHGIKRNPPSAQIIEELNSAAKFTKTETSSTTSKLEPASDEVIVGDEVLKIPENSSYNVHFPFRRGDLNFHTGVGGSLSSILIG